jgi:AbrB family looped-hinge helix DNA binding protein
MDSVKVSPKFQIVIPQKVRALLGVKPGQRLRVLAYDGQIIFIPLRPVSEARGSLRGLDTRVLREDEDRR